jgi:DNA ligase (NAD+)
MEALREAIQHHDYLYYVLDRPEIADEEYDRLFAQLQELERAHPDLVTADSPTQRVAGAPVAALPTVRHLAPMLSLEAVTDTSEVARFLERVGTRDGGGAALVLEPKVDGLSVEAVYEQGRLVRVSTRGDGERGEGVTESARTIRALPLTLRRSTRKLPRLLAVRGEVLLSRARFFRLNAELAARGEPAFANPRNAAAGSLRQLDPAVCSRRGLQVWFYDVLHLEDDGTGSASDWERLRALSDWGLPVVPDARRARSLQEVLAYHRDLESRRERVGFEVDGIVIKLDELAARGRVGATGRHPRWALAYKFTPREGKTEVCEVIAQVGRTGAITPVAVLAPVEISGVTVTRASLHNFDEIARRDIRPGDIVRVVRAGDVIPEVLGRAPGPDGSRGRPVVPPRRCPACGASLVREGPLVRCPNGLGCPAQLRHTIVHFARVLDIAGLGPRTVDRLVAAGLVREVADLFTLKGRDLVAIERMAELSAGKLVRAIEAAKRPELHRFIEALGIPGIGAETARCLSERLKSLQALLQAREADLAAIPGVGPVAAAAVVRFLAEPGSARTIERCLAAGVRPRATGVGGPMAGVTVVFTGRLHSMTRAQAEAMVRSLGGRTASTVSRQVDLVVAGEQAGDKYARARMLRVPVLTEAQFRQRVAGGK